MRRTERRRTNRHASRFKSFSVLLMNFHEVGGAQKCMRLLDLGEPPTLVIVFRRGVILALLTTLVVSAWAGVATARQYTGTTDKDRPVFFEVVRYSHRTGLALHTFDVAFAARCEDGSIEWRSGFGVSTTPGFPMTGHRIDLRYRKRVHLVGSFWRWQASGTIRVHYGTRDEDDDRTFCTSGKLDWTAHRPKMSA